MYKKYYARRITRKLLEQAYQQGGLYRGELKENEKLLIDTRLVDIQNKLRGANTFKQGLWENWEAEQIAIEKMLKPAF